jgi:hypothetical protein
MKRERGWFQVGAGLGLFLSFVLVLPGCAKVTVQTAPSGTKDITNPPTGSCQMHADGHCKKPFVGSCTCP